MIETTVLALFAMAMLSLAAGLWSLQRLLPARSHDRDGNPNHPNL